MIDVSERRSRTRITRAARMAALALVAFTAGACSSDSKKQVHEDPNVPPTEYKEQILRQLRVRLQGSTIRDAYVAAPLMKTYQETPRYIACLRFNAIGPGGAVVSRELAAFFYAGALTQIIEAQPDMCANSAYEPFPEAQKF